MGNEKKSIHVEVDPELHNDWSSFVDEQDDLTTLSGLIRRAVNDYIAEEGGDRTPPGGEQPAQVDLSPVEDSLYTIENCLSSLERELESINVASSARDDNRIEELAHYCREYLPLVEDKDELADLNAHATLRASRRNSSAKSNYADVA